MSAFTRTALMMLAIFLAVPSAQAREKVAILTTKFALQHRYKLMQEVARQQEMDVEWTQVDADAGMSVDRILNGASFVLVDAHTEADRSLIGRYAGSQLGASQLPSISVNNAFLPNSPTRGSQISVEKAQRIYEYFSAGTQTNYVRLFKYLKALAQGKDGTDVPAYEALPGSAIYHPSSSNQLFTNLDDYLSWWGKNTGHDVDAIPIVGMEVSSSYLSDGQTRLLDDVVRDIELRGALPIVFYRSGRATLEKKSTGARGSAQFSEPLLVHNGKYVLDVLLVNTFLGVAPDIRRAWHKEMGIPAINVLTYRNGTRADYLKDSAGISSFYLPFSLTSAEYIGLQDPVIAASNEGGELVPIPEQLDLLLGKAVNLARLKHKKNRDKTVALLFWNHPPGERNQGASNLNVPRSISLLVERMKSEGYSLTSATESEIISAVGKMLRPAYRPGTLNELIKTPFWDFLPLTLYTRWYETLPLSVRRPIDAYWGDPRQSYWMTRKDGVDGFVIPRMTQGNMLILPQPMRSESAFSKSNESKIYHDTKVPVSHAYLATYLWIRNQQKVDAIIHFGTHGTQEWTPGKERGLWAFDEPNLLVGNTPVVYPYIVDNISEALNVKRRGRGVVVSHQTPAFAPSGLSIEIAEFNDLIHEYQALDDGPVKEKNKLLIIERALQMNLHKDLHVSEVEMQRAFESFIRKVEDYLEDLAATVQPLGLHTLGVSAEQDHLVSTVMQMLGQKLYDLVGKQEVKKLFAKDFQQLQQTEPYQFVEKFVFSDVPLDSMQPDELRELAVLGRKYRTSLQAEVEIDAVLKALSAGWIDPSYGGDPVRNPDALPTGRNLYGFDPSRIPTKAAYEAGKLAVEELISSYEIEHKKPPEKLAFTLWSTETMRHLGMLEAQIMYAMGTRPKWDEGGRVVGIEVIPLSALKRPRIDTVISLTGLYRDQFPNVMERFNEAIAAVNALHESSDQNYVRGNTAKVTKSLLKAGVAQDAAHEFAATRIFGNESGDYGTKLSSATLASDTWNRGDGKLEELYLSRMSWAYGPNTEHWSQKLVDAKGLEINAYAEHLRGTSAVVFSRSSNLRGLLDTDHPFEYLGGLSLAINHLDGSNPPLYISNLRDPNRSRLETADHFLAAELRSIYQHPRWLIEMKKEGYAGTLQLLNTVNNFWGWQVMDKNVVRDDQWQEFHDIYVNDRYKLGLRQWFERNNPTALAQLTERMLEAIRKDYWKADANTQRELVKTYRDLAAQHDVFTSNTDFKVYVANLSKGFGLSDSTKGKPSDQSQKKLNPTLAKDVSDASPSNVIRGQELKEVQRAKPIEAFLWSYAWLMSAVVLAGIGYQAWKTVKERSAFFDDEKGGLS